MYNYVNDINHCFVPCLCFILYTSMLPYAQKGMKI